MRILFYTTLMAFIGVSVPTIAFADTVQPVLPNKVWLYSTKLFEPDLLMVQVGGGGATLTCSVVDASATHGKYIRYEFKVESYGAEKFKYSYPESAGTLEKPIVIKIERIGVGQPSGFKFTLKFHNTYDKTYIKVACRGNLEKYFQSSG